MEQAPTSRKQITNPYAKDTRSEYKMGSIEKFMHDTLGFRTGIDQYNEQMDNAAAEWETQNQSLGYEENYNSPEAQATRMRAAGLNPDLDPGTISPGEAGEMTESQLARESPAGTDMEVLQGIGEGVASLGMTILGTVGDLVGLSLKIGQRDTQEIDIAERMLGLVDESMGMYPELGAEEFGGHVEDNGTSAVAKMLGMSKRNSKRFDQARRQYMNSIPGIMKRQRRETEAKEVQTLYDIADTMNKHLVKKSENELYMEERFNELMKEYPDVIDESILANWRRGIFETQKAGAEANMAGTEAKVQKAESKARTIYAEYKEIQAQTDKEILQEYNKIIEEGEYWKNPGAVIKFHDYDRRKRNAERRAYGRTSEGIEDYAGDAVKVFK